MTKCFWSCHTPWTSLWTRLRQGSSCHNFTTGSLLFTRGIVWKSANVPAEVESKKHRAVAVVFKVRWTFSDWYLLHTHKNTLPAPPCFNCVSPQKHKYTNTQIQTHIRWTCVADTQSLQSVFLQTHCVERWAVWIWIAFLSASNIYFERDGQVNTQLAVIFEFSQTYQWFDQFNRSRTQFLYQIKFTKHVILVVLTKTNYQNLPIPEDYGLK